MKVAVTGANGFIGKNLVVRLAEVGHEAQPIDRRLEGAALAEALKQVDLVVHLAGVNRPQDDSEFESGNSGHTKNLVDALASLGRPVPVIFSSSIQAELDNPYGRSKRQAELAIEDYGQRTQSSVQIWRLPNVFGKWSRPNYNSVVATFCHNVARALPIAVSDPGRTVRLVYVDDVVEALLEWVAQAGQRPVEVKQTYEVSLGELASMIEGFRASRATLLTGPVGTGLARALHATYLSFLDPADFAYPLTAHTDPRGTFAEMLRTPAFGQFSFFTAHPGITRGGHYHHSKTEKFLVVHGRGRFGFRNIVTNETSTLETTGEVPTVVETVPGWSHDITNVGDDLMVVMLWANELFDRDRPDTIAAKVLP